MGLFGPKMNLLSPVRQKLGLNWRGEKALALEPPFKMLKSQAQTFSAWRDLKPHVPSSLKLLLTRRTYVIAKWSPATPIVEHMLCKIPNIKWDPKEESVFLLIHHSSAVETERALPGITFDVATAEHLGGTGAEDARNAGSPIYLG